MKSRNEAVAFSRWAGGGVVTDSESSQITYLIPETQIELELLRHVVLACLRDAGLDWAPALDDGEIGVGAFGILRDAGGAIVWVKPVRREDGSFGVVMARAPHVFSPGAFKGTPAGGHVAKKIAAAWQGVVADRVAGIRAHLESERMGDYVEVASFSGINLKITNPLNGRPMEVTYVDFRKPSRVIVGGYQDDYFVRAPKTYPHVVSRPVRAKLKLDDLPAAVGLDVLRLVGERIDFDPEDPTGSV